MLLPFTFHSLTCFNLPELMNSETQELIALAMQIVKNRVTIDTQIISSCVTDSWKYLYYIINLSVEISDKIIQNQIQGLITGKQKEFGGHGLFPKGLDWIQISLDQTGSAKLGSKPTYVPECSFEFFRENSFPFHPGFGQAHLLMFPLICGYISSLL